MLKFFIYFYTNFQKNWNVHTHPLERTIYNDWQMLRLLLGKHSTTREKKPPGIENRSFWWIVKIILLIKRCILSCASAICHLPSAITKNIFFDVGTPTRCSLLTYKVSNSQLQCYKLQMICQQVKLRF